MVLIVVWLLRYWHTGTLSHQQVCVRWRNSMTTSFHTGNGTRQGGILSLTLFSRYIRDLLAELAKLQVGCNIGGLFVNVLAYADDLVLFVPSWSALQQLPWQLLNNTLTTLTWFAIPKSPFAWYLNLAKDLKSCPCHFRNLWLVAHYYTVCLCLFCFYYFAVFYCVCLFCLSSLCMFMCMCILCSYGPRFLIQINGWRMDILSHIRVSQFKSINYAISNTFRKKFSIKNRKKL